MADTTADIASTKPVKPDEAKYKSDLAEAQKKHTAAQDKFKAANQKSKDARGTGGNKPDDKWSQLIEEQKQIRSKQAENKSAKSGVHDKFNKNDALIKTLIAEQKDSRNRSGFKSEDEIESKIKSLQAKVESGNMKVVDEKKTLDEISKLNREKKSFASLGDQQKRIDTLKEENTELKKSFDNQEARDLDARYKAIKEELDQIKAGRDEAYKSRGSLKAEADRLYEESQAAYLEVKKIKDDHFNAVRAHREWENVFYQARRDKQKAERDAYEKEKRRKIAETRLEEASAPAFGDEIMTAEGLIKHFDPTYSTSTSDAGPGKYAASAQRTVDESGFKGMKVMKKEEEDFFTGAGGKKKKGKKGATTNGTESAKFNMSIDVIEGLAKVGVDPPSTQADVAGVVEQLKSKVEGWRKDQKAETEKVSLSEGHSAFANVS